MPSGDRGAYDGAMASDRTQIERLRLTNFRSYPTLEVPLADRTVLVGRNAAGKTNILEALYLLSSTKSFRADREREMIRWGETEGHVAVTVTRGETTHELSCGLGLGARAIKKQFMVDGSKKPAAALPALLPAALFSADDVRLIDGAPGRRRRALDLVIGQGSVVYLDALRRYGRVLASRNRLLERIRDGEAGRDELEYWDTQLAEAAEVILEGRTRFTKFLNQRLTDRYHAIAPHTDDSLEISYEPLTTDPAADLARGLERDIAVGTTTVGPHRDDWKLLLGNRPLSSFGSGGEFRSGMLAFRMGEAAWLESELGTVPVILLDDVFSELDAGRREALLSSLSETQVIITTPERSEIPDSFAEAEVVTVAKDQAETVSQIAVTTSGGSDV